MTTATSSATLGQLTEREYKRRIRAWTMYDWANSAFATTILSAVLPIYYSNVAGATLPSEAAATSLWSMGLSISLLIVAVLSPILGTISDVMRGKKRFLSIFVGMGVLATGLLVLVSTGDWLLASILFIFGRMGFTGANVFYDSLLPHVAKEKDQDSVSTRGYAMGYLGGGLLLAINIAMIKLIPNFFDYAGSRLSLLSVGVWWLIFSIPIFTRVPEPPSATSSLAPGENVVSASFKQLASTLKDIRRYKELFKYLIAFLIYNDGIGTIIGVAAIYGAELGFGDIELILALLLVQFVGIPFSLIFGRIPSKETKRRPQFLALVVFNIVMLPLVGIVGRHMLPSMISGAPPLPYSDTAEARGEGIYLADGEFVQYEGEWSAVVVPAEDLSGGRFFEFINTVFGDPLEDKTYLTSDQPGSGYDFAFNGQDVKITYSIGPEAGTWLVMLDGQPLLDEDGQPVEIDASSDSVRYGVIEALSADEPGEHTLSLLNSDAGGLMTLSQLEVLKPRRQNNLAAILGMVLAVQILGIGFAALLGRSLFSKLAERMDTKRSIILALVVYAVIAIWAFFLNSTVEFWFLAFMVAIVQGGSQALSRSLYASMSPASKSGEFFGLFGVMEKFSAILGPILFAAAGAIFGNSRPAILSLIAFFIVGIIILNFVDTDEGRRVAQAEDKTLLAGT